ncbi:MAG: ferritin [Synergistaceae bacterium]|jgi:hypothetical protein|nr:ferritin [Synergistaceae bacterium]
MSFYVPYSDLPREAVALDSAIESLREELEATNLYHQRYLVLADESLKKMMLHNRDEEIEHCAMLIEWLRREVPEFDRELRKYLFTDAGIMDIEAAPAGEGNAGKPAGGSLGIGSLRGNRRL